MKKFLKSTAVLALCFATTTGMANEPKISLLPGNEAKSLVFELDSKAQDSKIKLTDENAYTIYFENVMDANYAKNFNLKELEVGTYYFSVENDLTSIVYTLDLNSSDVKISNKEENTTNSIFRKVGDKVHVNLFNTDQKKVDIEIVDSSSNIVFKESTKGELIIGKTFNFEKALKGSYTIMVKDGHETYYQNIVIG